MLSALLDTIHCDRFAPNLQGQMNDQDGHTRKSIHAECFTIIIV